MQDADKCNILSCPVCALPRNTKRTTPMIIFHKIEHHNMT